MKCNEDDKRKRLRNVIAAIAEMAERDEELRLINREFWNGGPNMVSLMNESGSDE